jgi:hypothetical protein
VLDRAAEARPPSETIVLETGEFDLDIDDPPPSIVGKRLTLNNRVRATMTELVFYREHYLLVREKRKGKRPRSALVNLRYLDTRPALARFVATKVRRTAVGSTLAAMLAGALAYLEVGRAVTASVAAGMTGVAVAAVILYAYRTTETISFRTAEGRVPAFALRANVGCIRACRALVPPVIRAVAEARRSCPPDTAAYLRREMREHYRLHEAGVLSAAACRTGTRRILAKF